MKKGFTLIELLIVIGILALLATLTIMVLNPAQMLAESRDVQRLNDMSTISSAISLFLATVTIPTFTTAFNCTVGTVPFAPDTGPCATNVVRTTAGAGWVNVNLSLISGGSPIAALPLDPIQNATFYYIFRADGPSMTFELNANLESTRHSPLEANDGGDNPNAYERGNSPGLVLI